MTIAHAFATSIRMVNFRELEDNRIIDLHHVLDHTKYTATKRVNEDNHVSEAGFNDLNLIIRQITMAEKFLDNSDWENPLRHHANRLRETAGPHLLEAFTYWVATTGQTLNGLAMVLATNEKGSREAANGYEKCPACGCEPAYPIAVHLLAC